MSKVSPALFSPIKTSFQDRVAEYRSRSDSTASAVSPSSPTSSGSIYNGHHPFPTVDQTSQSSSPPRSATLPAVSISIEAPAPEEDSTPLSSSPTHVHARSHSFTPKLHSKLATPRYPPSPQRGNEREHDARDLDQPLQGTPTRPAFNFGLGGVGQSKAVQESNATPSPSAGHRSTTLLPPPTIVEPDQNKDEQDEHDPKRSSQILYHSGFINRLADIPANFNHANLPLSKGWKPFKLELKGSKLYFYKPPGDRANGIRDLFPTTLVPPSEQDNDDDNNLEPSSAQSEDLDGSGRSRKAKTKDDTAPGTLVRKKRAYWGRKTHPDLILDTTGNIEKGTFEALTHESVFATTFSMTDTDPPTEEHTGGKQRWQEFSSSVIFSIPAVVGRQIFEVEFLRCCSFLVSGAEENLQTEVKSRVSWLATEYLRCHEQPVDMTSWDDWKRDTIPGVVLSCEGPQFSSSAPVSPSSKAIYHPSPVPSDTSPHLNMFSPRPEDGGKMILLLEALSPAHQSQEKQSSRQGLAPPNSRFPWSTLQEEGLTRDLLLRLDSYLVARSLALFHRSVLDMCPDNITAEFITNTEAQSDQENDIMPVSAQSVGSLFGSEDHPHWLTKLVLLQILGADTSSGHNYASQNTAHLSSPARRSEDRGNTQTSRTHSRSELVSVWTRIGEFCRTAGDECSWKAISAALCSRPVARLDKVWKRVDPQALAAIESWASFSSDGSPPSASQPPVTVWGGDIKVRLNEELARASGGDQGEVMITMDHVVKARSLFETFRTSFLLCPRKTYISENEVGEDLRNLVAFWRDTAAQGGVTSGLAVKFQRYDLSNGFSDLFI